MRRAFTVSTILLGGLFAMATPRLGGSSSFTMTAKILGGFTVFSMATTRLERGTRTRLGGPAIFATTPAFLGGSAQFSLQGLFAGRPIHIIRSNKKENSL